MQIRRKDEGKSSINRRYSNQQIKKKQDRMNIYIGNLADDVTEDDLRDEFENFGQVNDVKILKDKFSGESRGYGFVKMPKKKEAKSAIMGLNGKELKGKVVYVNKANS